MVSFLESLPVTFISKKMYLKNKLIEEGDTIFQCLDDPDIQDVINQFRPLPKKRFQSDKFHYVKLAYWLSLPHKPSMKILDLGGRHGMWGYICEHYKHDVLNTDLEEVLNLPEVDQILKKLGIKSKPLMIKPLEPISDEWGKFDIITGLRTRFHSIYSHENELGTEEHWGVDEWDFFLKDMATHLNKGGQIFLLLNRLQSHKESEEFPTDLIEYFKTKGGKIGGPYLWFKNVERILQ